MEVDEESPVPSPVPAESSAAVPDNQNVIDTTLVQLIQPSIPPVIPAAIPVVPPIAPIPPIASAPIPRPLAPLPIRPSVLRPPLPQNGELGISDSDSDQDDFSPSGTATGATGDYEVSEGSRQVRERQQKAMQELMMKRRAAALAVPTNDMAVRARLRRLGEPITLFGEREMERRDRLRMLMAKLDSEGQLEKLMKAHEEEEAATTTVAEDAGEEMLQYPFYTEGSRELMESRIDIAKYSILRAAVRLQRARRKRDDPDEDVDSEIDWALKQASGFSLDHSENGDDRPLSGCSFSNDGKLLATWYVSLYTHINPFVSYVLRLYGCLLTIFIFVFIFRQSDRIQHVNSFCFFLDSTLIAY